jgi:ketosteroid isomerase-like protein
VNGERDRNVEHMRRMLEVHNRSGEALVERYDEFFHPDFEWVPAVVGGVEGSSYRGREGMRRYYRDRDEAFTEGRVEVVSCEAIADDVVVVLARSTGRGRASGAMVDEEVGIVCWLRDGRISREHAYTSHAAALAAGRAEATVDA